MSDFDNTFFDRADEHIHLANAQFSKGITRGKVSSSFMYAVARYNAYLCAGRFTSADDMKSKKRETIKYFTDQYAAMLEENLDDHIENFETYFSKDSG